MRASRSRRSGDAARAVVLTGRFDARLRQLVLVLFVGCDIAIRASDSPAGVGLDGWPGAGLLLLVLLTVATAVVPVRWRHGPAGAVVPVLDFLGIGLVRMDTSGTAAGILVVIPALWLGRELGRRGAPVSVVACLLLASGPGLLYLPASAVEVSRALLIAVVAGWTSLATALALEQVARSRDEAEQRGRALAEALDTIEHQKRVSDAILDTVDVGLVLLDGDGNYQATNQRHADFLRLAYPQGHAGRAGQLGEVFAPDGVTTLVREEMPTYRASRGQEYDDCRIWVGSDPVTRRALSVSARRVEDADGTFAGAALAYKDVTEFMRALSVKDEFVSSVSHELRTPLTSIVGYVNILLEREDLPGDVVRQLGVVARNSARLNRLVADLLHTARADEGPMQVVRAEMDLAAVVRDCVAAAAPAAERAGVVLETDLPERQPVVADPQRMAQVVDNLVSNAIKYTVGGGVVRISLAVDADRVELVVADTGIGISATDRHRLFTRFFRTRHAAEQSIQGVGLGLSITKAIVESHGGRIEVDSELGRGSEFRVRLPVTGC